MNAIGSYMHADVAALHIHASRVDIHVGVTLMDADPIGIDIDIDSGIGPLRIRDTRCLSNR